MVGPPLSEVFQGLIALAGRLRIAVRIEPMAFKIGTVLGTKGGLCKLGGAYVVLVDERLSLIERIGVLGEALGKILPPTVEIPDLLVPYLRTGHGRVRPLVQPRPLARPRPRSR